MRTRRSALRLALAGAALTGLIQGHALAQDATPAEMSGAPGTDIALGKADAPVTVIEYASMTCSHCAAFHVQTVPDLKRRYVDAGTVRFVLRPFPLDNLALAAFMLAKCRSEADYYPFVDLLFRKQADWAFTKNPLEALTAVAKEGGIEGPQLEACLKDQKLYDAVIASREYGATTLKVTSTPTLFVDGRRTVGGVGPERLDEILAPALAAKGIAAPAPAAKDASGAR